MQVMLAKPAPIFLWCIFLLGISIGLARLTSNLSWQVSWPLVLLIGGGGLGLAAAILVQVLDVPHSKLALVVVLAAALGMSVMEHYFIWRDTSLQLASRLESERQETLKKFPALVGMLPEPILPTWSEFMLGDPNNRAQRWSFWALHAALELALAGIVFSFWPLVAQARQATGEIPSQSES
jgi:hypothetical protein